MGFTDRFNNAIRAFNTKSLGNSVSGSVTRNYFNGHNSPEHNFKGLAYKVVDKIGQSVSKYEPKVYRGDSYLETHPFYTLHNAPNPDQKTGAYFNHLWAMLDEIYGKTFWYIVRGENSRKIKELYLLDPSRMQVHREDGIIVGYTLNKYNGEQIPFTPDEIYFDRTPNPFNPDE
ncbi:phage portal protein, partial [Candidatus Saccharibacteria bacterium]|nr:phage portal protein [Candidatus Saccharibacteria bacterium]